MMRSRWILFLIAILIGAGLGLLYGWVVNPVDYVDTTPDTLRVDYKTDYVLMVAEAYQGDVNPELATRRLAILGDARPSDIVYQSMLFAEKAGYTDIDMARLQDLLSALQAYDLIWETPAP
ncbi:hypothetical protein ACFLZW_06345 [Chloroflexota bacterium]